MHNQARCHVVRVIRLVIYLPPVSGRSPTAPFSTLYAVTTAVIKSRKTPHCFPEMTYPNVIFNTIRNPPSAVGAVAPPLILPIGGRSHTYKLSSTLVRR
ncbi:hypothetical protein XELAEV_18012574mg [Xenopus laevis]|uniref:Secreted protein n=1 Tax=Xenopus laevis TaxID=8355 RepID=A0A974HYU3_XENLA|nr:hypothetical protein XELAEV_18012574mg [Xenopus laevis]